ncbi:hypothetical protein [Streptomyces alkaliterrae]|uniref:hypothetical protein n=1 Tax=Streptomyces alkaliterrae TaxID=2213162 RepID=UPI001E451424|nr:hypothetical protein [Streptomyces alkaliterrae]
MSLPRPTLRTLTGPLAALLVGVTVAGCGIRATSVPVDDGPAPSRVACAIEHEQGGDGAPQAGPDGELRIALVCSGRVVDVRRQVPLRQGESAADRLAAARTLLAELRREPGPREQEAGFTTAVPEDLRVFAPDQDDDSSALRLSRHPNELPPFALAQIVCTFAATTIADANRQVLLGGPSSEPGKPLKLYECGTALRTTTEAAETAGVPF